MHVGAPVKHHIQYATSSDGVRIAYGAMGQGTPVVRASHWLTHLEYELDSPVWRHLILGMASRHKFIRYDGRGTGLSQRDAVDISMDRWVSDLECIVDSLSLERFILLGVSQGGAISIEYAACHPDRGIASDHSWGVCARLSPSRKSRQATTVRRAQSSSSSRGLGQRARRLSAVVHLAIHPGRHGRAIALVQQPGAGLRDAGNDGEIRDRALRDQRHRLPAEGEGADVGHPL